MKRVISCVLLMLVLTSNAFALEVPTDTVVQNLNGSQQAIKTFTVSPEQDPAALIEEPFELEGYLYTFADIVKSENPVEEKRIHTEVITVETTKDDLALILEQLKPTIEYDDGRFQGTLKLDHTSLNTVAAGYATKNYTVTETKPTNAIAGLHYSLAEYTVTVTVPADMGTPTVSIKQVKDDNGKTVDNQSANVAKFTNTYVAVSALPLTGGTTDRQWLLVGGSIGGLAVLLVGAAGIWNSKKRLV